MAGPRRTNPDCMSANHQSNRAWESGCRCDEAIAAHQARLARKCATAAARWREEHHVPRKVTQPLPEPAPDPVVGIEPDYVAVHEFISGRIPFRALEFELDRSAVVAELAHTMSADAIAAQLNVDLGRVLGLMRTARNEMGDTAAHLRLRLLSEVLAETYPTSLAAESTALPLPCPRVFRRRTDASPETISRRRREIDEELRHRSTAGRAA